jgi:hypothetical protein
MPARHPAPTLDLLRERCTVTDDGCWLWNGSMYSNGYGRVSIASTHHLTHRITAALHHGLPYPLPRSLVVRHRCEHKHCISPAHLIIGTQGDNVLDAIRAGSMPWTFADGRCARGHDLSQPGAVYVYPTGDSRRCEVCRRAGRAR